MVKSEKKSNEKKPSIWMKAIQGRPRDFKSVEEFREAAVKYIKYAEKTPLKKGLDKIDRPFSLKAFCLHSNIDFQTFLNYSNKEGYEEFFDICNTLTDICSTQRTEGGLVGIYNHSLVARLEGLTEKTEVSSTNINLDIVQEAEECSEEDLRERIIKLTNNK